MIQCLNHGKLFIIVLFFCIVLFLLNREIALCGLAIFLCEELKHQRAESPIRPFIVFIVECLQVGFI